MEIEYEFQTSPSEFDDDLGEEYFETDTFVFNTTEQDVDVEEALTDIIYNQYFSDCFKTNIEKTMFKKKLKEFISYSNGVELEDLFYEGLKDYFEPQAREQFYEN